MQITLSACQENNSFILYFVAGFSNLLYNKHPKPVAVILQTEQLNKRYGGIQAVDRLSLQVEQGSIYGLLGPNGSGKTTTLGMVLDVIRPTSGSFAWFGQPVSRTTKHRIGALLETPNFYPYLTARRNLEIAAEIKGVDHKRIAQVLHLVGLSQRSHTTFKGFSLGMKQRLALAATLLNDPEVLVLDEPTNGLDPEGIAEVRELILQIAAQGKTIILASHLLDEVEKVCTHVAVLQKGMLRAEGRVDTILSAKDQFIISARNLPQVLEVLKQLPFVAAYQPEGEAVNLTLNEGYGSADVNKAMFEAGVVLQQLTLRRKSLEAQFLEIIKSQA
ncbi:ABC transporter ATP-binding protein [Pontibacter anaerobius]|uniref:ATP-binding cassette domain-containing protein n=1 Tax=Pontibacter anaerobius TaxID=2993940 RepID=A0ABT3REP8_9BACT|nr:ATP-binding cassette domain-containing protein [Pontibacter anaerobius]MCX2739923.1 ATP-binding cassette domain-containing protein [Pontibacter anaerobius]